MSEQQEAKIIVVGSLNADLVQPVQRLPVPGETLTGGELSIYPGGKGANQACAAATLGGRAAMVGQVGGDTFGSTLTENLRRVNVDVSLVRTSAAATGTACILVLPSGENVIIISPGANGAFSPEAARQSLEVIPRGAIVLAQLEIPLATTALALRIARQRGAVTILDPAPAQPLERSLLEQVDYLTPNQTEAALLLGSDQPIESYADAEAAAKQLLAQGPATVIVKMGSMGVVLASAGGCERVSGFPVKSVDTTAAGDTFNGAFAVALSEGKNAIEAARFANAAGAISVTRMGAQSSIPTRAETDRFLEQRTSA